MWYNHIYTGSREGGFMDCRENLKGSVDKQILEMLSTLPTEELMRIYAYIKELYFSDNPKVL